MISVTSTSSGVASVRTLLPKLVTMCTKKTRVPLILSGVRQAILGQQEHISIILSMEGSSRELLLDRQRATRVVLA